MRTLGEARWQRLLLDITEEALWRLSAETMSSIQINHTVVAVMKEKGIDLSKNRPKMLESRNCP